MDLKFCRLELISLFKNGSIPCLLRDANEQHSAFIVKIWAQLFEGGLALKPGLNLTWDSFSFVQKHFLRQFSLLFLRASNHQLVDRKN